MKKTPIRLTVLGCGTSTGVPLIHCKCAVCRSKNPKNQRLRASVWIQAHGKSLLIDTSTDLRQQAIRAKIPRIDAVLYTHPHADHMMGIDELRSFNFIQNEAIPVYGNSWTISELEARFSYIFSPASNHEGGGIPRLTKNLIPPQAEHFLAAGVEVIPLPVAHGSQETLGFRVDSVAYVTDCSDIPDATRKRIHGVQVLVLDCLRIAPHRTHFNFEQSMAFIDSLTRDGFRPKRVILTHMGHDFDYPRWIGKLPKGVSLAFDGQKVEVR